MNKGHKDNRGLVFVIRMQWGRRMKNVWQVWGEEREGLRTERKPIADEQVLYKQSIRLENTGIAAWANDPKWSNWSQTFREEAEVSEYCSVGPLISLQLFLFHLMVFFFISWFLYFVSPERNPEKYYGNGGFSKLGCKKSGG